MIGDKNYHSLVDIFTSASGSKCTECTIDKILSRISEKTKITHIAARYKKNTSSYLTFMF